MRKWGERHENFFLSLMDPIWCGPKKFRLPRPKKVVFQGAENSAKSDFWLKFSKFSTSASLRGAKMGWAIWKFFSELYGPNSARAENIFITPLQKRWISGCRKFYQVIYSFWSRKCIWVFFPKCYLDPRDGRKSPKRTSNDPRVPKKGSVSFANDLGRVSSVSKKILN